MKYIKTQQEMVDYLRELFMVYNHELYEGKLHTPVINVGVLLGKQLSRYIPGVWSDAKGRAPEIMFNPSFLGAKTTNISSISVELLHCMAHQYCDENNIKDTSNRGAYHNKRFRTVAENHGLKSLGSSGKGWCGGYKDYTIADESVVADICKDFSGRFFIQRDFFTHNSRGLGCHNRKYVCPCGTIVRATKEVHIRCEDCGGKFQMA